MFFGAPSVGRTVWKKTGRLWQAIDLRKDCIDPGGQESECASNHCIII